MSIGNGPGSGWENNRDEIGSDVWHRKLSSGEEGNRVKSDLMFDLLSNRSLLSCGLLGGLKAMASEERGCLKVELC